LTYLKYYNIVLSVTQGIEIQGGKVQNNYNASHPELQHGEVFLRNIYPRSSRIFGNLAEYDWPILKREWETARQGTAAYYKTGEKAPDQVPIFVSRDECLKKGIDPDSLNPDF